MTTDGERITKLEAKAEAYDKILQQNSDTLAKVSCSLRQLVALEERHQALDRRHETLREEFSKLREKNENRTSEMDHVISAIQSATDINSHGRSMWEKILMPAVSGITSGLIVGGILATSLSGGF